MADTAAQSITNAIVAAGNPAICVYLTGGYPTPESFVVHLEESLEAADVVEIGVPFSDPMADGLTIQRSSRIALQQGVTLAWILETLARRSQDLATPVLLMGYYNPFLSFGLDRLPAALAGSRVAGLIVPDLPYEESEPLGSLLAGAGLALIPLVTPTTPDQRIAQLAASGDGFVYAVTTTGVTGGDPTIDLSVTIYLDRVRAVSPRPVLAGFGVRTRAQIDSIAAHADGVVIGSALIDAIDAGIGVKAFIDSLRPEEATP